MELCRMLHEENGLFAMSEDKVRKMTRIALTRQVTPECRHPALIGVIGGPNNLEGCICLQITQMFYTDDWHLGELWNFVRPEARKSAHANALLDFAKQCSEQVGLPLVIGVISNTRTEAKVRLYERRFPKVGAFFVHNVTTSPAIDQKAR